jgi:hypothetical protein
MNRSPRLVGFIVIGSLGLAGSTWARADAPKAPGQGRLTESFCKASATRKAAAAAMNKQGVTSSKVKFLRFEYLERVRKDEFCAYTAVLADGVETLFAAFRLPGGRFRFKHID